MQIVTFPTTLHGERVWGYVVRYNGVTITSGYAPTKERAEFRAEYYLRSNFAEVLCALND